MNLGFTISIKKEGKWYVAKAIEYAVVSQGKTQKEAQNNLKEAVSLFLEKQSEKNAPSEPSHLKTLRMKSV